MIQVDLMALSVGAVGIAVVGYADEVGLSVENLGSISKALWRVAVAVAASDIDERELDVKCHDSRASTKANHS